MKDFRMLSMVVLTLCGWITSHGQDIQAEVPGDHFSLEGALELFKESESPEEFEKLLNSPDSKVNNLDLNDDGYIDYIRVFDRNEGNIHVFILQAVVSESENQDVAVIELEKRANGKAVLQIIGDEDIYGVETIIEPTREVRTYAGTTTTTTVVNVWSWPVVHHVYSPYYSAWSSPWGWHHRPVWWRTWGPVVYVHHYDYWRPYRSRYARCHTHRVAYAHNIYRPHRATSVTVHNKHHGQVTKYRDNYRDTNNGRDRQDHARNSGSSTYGATDQSRHSFMSNERSRSDDNDIVLRNRSKYDRSTERKDTEISKNRTEDNLVNNRIVRKTKKEESISDQIIGFDNTERQRRSEIQQPPLRNIEHARSQREELPKRDIGTHDFNRSRENPSLHTQRKIQRSAPLDRSQILRSEPMRRNEPAQSGNMRMRSDNNKAGTIRSAEVKRGRD